MKEVQKTITLYRFEELSEESQGKFQQTFSDDFDQDFSDCYEPDFIKRLSDMGIETENILYSGFCNQGDGLSFLGTIHEKYLLPFIQKYEFSKLSDYVKNEHEELFLVIRSKNINYVHENSVYCDVPEDLDLSDDLYSELNELSDLVNDARMSLCRELYSELERNYDYTMSYEHAQEIAELNDYWFTADGSIDNE